MRFKNCSKFFRKHFTQFDPSASPKPSGAVQRKTVFSSFDAAEGCPKSEHDDNEGEGWKTATE